VCICDVDKVGDDVLAVGSAARPWAIVQRRPDGTALTSTAAIKPSTFAIRRCSGTSVGCTRSSMPSRPALTFVA
jgi:hypothetical protein